MTRGGTITIPTPGVLGNDAAIAAARALLVTPPAHGTLILGPTGSFTYHHDGSTTAVDNFTYRLSDGHLESNIANVAINIVGAVSTPIANADQFSISRGATLTIAAPGLLANDTDSGNNTLVATMFSAAGHGTVSGNGDGSFTYVNDGSAATSDTFTYRASNGVNTSTPATVTITVVATNAAPSGVGDAYSVSRGGIVSIAAPGVLANDSDPEGSRITAALASFPAHGRAILDANGALIYQHDGSATTSDSFTYRISDGQSTSAAVTVSITVNNAAPVASGDAYGVSRGATLTVGAPGVIDNDFDANGDALRASVVTNVAHGTVTLSPNGAFTYVHDGGSSTSDSFTYKVNDGLADSNVATVTIAIVAATQPVVAINDAYSVARGGTLTIGAPGVLANDSDPQHNPLTASVATAPAHGTLTLNADGSFTYQNAGDPATSDSFTYRASNGFGSPVTATVTMSITATNQPPVANGDTYAVTRGQSLDVSAPGLLSNDSDPEGAALSAHVVTSPFHGIVTVGADGSFTYINDGSSATTDSFTYAANDGQADSAPATVTISVRPSAAPPAVSNDSYSVTAGGLLNVPAPGVLGNDSDPQGNPLAVILVTTTSHGALTLNADGSFSYQNNNDGASTDTFAYRADNGFAQSSAATVTINIGGTSGSPVVANGDNYTAPRAGQLDVAAPGVLANDTGGANPLTASAVTPPAHGTVSVNSNGAFTYRNDGSSATADSFTYKATDGVTSANATASIAIAATNQPPAAAADAYTVAQGATITIGAPGVLANDRDPEGNPLHAVQVTAPSHGALTLNANGSFTYVNDGVSAAADSFTYKANDGSADSNVVTVSITVTPVNHAPVANNDTFSTNQDAALTVAAPGVLANDSDSDANPLTAIVVVTTTHGVLALNADGGFTYTPAAGFTGTDTFTYKANDGTADSNTATVTISIVSVVPPNHAPSFVKGADQTSLEDAGFRSVSNWATAINANDAGQTVHFNIVSNSNPALFALQPSISPTGTLSYTTAPDANGSATITINLQDDGGTANGGADKSPNQTFVINVTAVNDAPSFSKGVDQTVFEDSPAKTVLNWATGMSPGPANEGGETLNFIVSNDKNALFSVQPAVSPIGTLTFTPAANAFGVATVNVQIHDDGGTANGGIDTSVVQTFTITITGINDAPTFVKGADQTVLEDAGAQTVTNWATAISAGPNEAQIVHFNVVGNTNAALFSVAPAISATGTLTYTPAPNANGSATITVNLQDNGGTANGGVDTSASQSFVINVTAVNDVPSFTKGADQSFNEDSGAHTIATWATAISAGPTDEAGQALNFIVTNDNNALFSAQPAIASNGTLTFTVAANANGVANVSVQLHDNGGTANGGVDTSAAQTFTITITGINDVPSFVKGADQMVLEDAGAQTVVGWATAISAGPNESAQTVHFNIVGNTNPALFSAGPAVAANGTLTYTTAANKNGSATITLNIQDDGGTANGGVDTSATQTFVINVTAVNDAPGFTKGADQTSAEDSGLQTVAAWATAINAGPPDETGQALNFIVTNDNNALFSAQPAIAPNGTLTYTAAANANGVANVTVTLHDNGGTANGGVDTSAAQTFVITIAGVDDAPVNSVPPAQNTFEDTPVVFSAANGNAITISDIDAGAGSLKVTLTATNGTINGNPTMTITGTVAAINTALNGVTFTPSPDFNGTAGLTILTDDQGNTGSGGPLTDSDSITINVAAVNDAPSFTKGADQTVLEDAVAQSVPNWATAISAGPTDEGGQSLTFAVTNNNNALFSAQPAIAANGTLTFTPAANANGSAIVTVRLQDNGGTANGGVDTSAAQTFTIGVTAVNDVPSFTAGGNQTVLEDAGPQTVAGWATAMSTGPANESTQTLQFLVTNDNNALFSAQPSVAPNGTLTYTPAANANGSATVSVRIQDNGGTLNGGVDTSAAQTFTITVTAVNDVPTFTSGGNVTVNEDSAAYSATWATAITAGPPDENGQSVTFFTSNDNPSIFVAMPSIASNGTLSFSLQPNAYGTATVSVYAQDNGGTANGGIDTTATVQFTITVNSVNDAPSFTAGANQNVNEDAGAQTVAGWATAISVGPNEPGQTVHFNVSNDNTALFSAQPAVTPSGTLTYTPAPNANGTATVTINIQDDGGTANGGVDTSASQTSTITVAPVNDAPTFTSGGNVTVNEDSGAYSAAWATAISKGPANENAQSLTFVITSNTNTALFNVVPAIDASGVLTFTPKLNANGTAQITVHLHDDGGTLNGGADNSGNVVFNINITAVNDAPVANNDTYAITEGGPPLSGSTVLANDTDVEGDPLTAILVTTPAHGSITFNANGTFTYNHDGTDTGNDSFTYKANDGAADSNVATVTINVTPSNDAPVARIDTYAVSKGSTLTTTSTNGVLANDTDEENNALTAVLVTGPANASSFTLNANGSFTYTHNNGSSTSDSFTYKANDGLLDSNTVTVTISIVQSNTAPVANNDTYTVSSGQTLNGATVLGNDTDAEGSPLTAILIATTSNGTLTLNANGVFTYTPTGAFTGADTFTYKANDGQLDSNTATVTINVVATNQAPTANADAYHVVRGGTLAISAPGVLGNDTDPESSALTANLVSSVAHGALTLNADGSFTYVNDGSANTTDSFTYRANDGQLNSAQATVTITINATNSAPVATADTYSTDEDTPLNVAAAGVLSNDTDADGDVLHAVLVSGVSHGVLTLNANGSFNYVPAQNYNGSDAFTYKANDGALDSNVVAVSITVNAVNDAPVANNDSGYSILSGQTLNVVAPGVLANDTDVEGSALTAIKVTDPQHGTVTVNANGSFTYVSDGSPLPVVSDSFTYKVNDGTADSAPATVSITITHNQSPVANPDSYSVNRNGSLTVPATGVLANDTDAEGDPLTAIKVTDPAHGTLNTFNADGSFSYTPTPGYFGPDSFTYKANDTHSDSSIATVTITVNNQAPTAGGDSYTAVGNTPLNVGTSNTGIAVVVAGSVLGNDTDPNNDSLTVSSVTVNVTTTPVSGATTFSTAHGSATINPDGTFTYTPAAGYRGSDSFNYTASDGALTSTATVNLTVSGMVWYVKNNNFSGTAGTSTDPFPLLSTAQTTSIAGDVIYVYRGTGGGTGLDAGIVLKDNQTLAGAGIADFVANGVTVTAPLDGSGTPQISNNAGAAVTLANNNTVRGVWTTTTVAANPAISGNALTTGATFNTVQVTSSTGAGISLTNSATITTSLTNVVITGTTGAAISGTNFGTITVNAGCSISAVTAFALDTGTINTVVPFTSVTTSGGTNGVSLTSIAGTLNVDAGTVDGSSGAMFVVSGGTFSSNWNGSVLQSNNAALLSVTGHSAGTIAFGGTLFRATNGSGIQFTNASGTYTFPTGGAFLSGGNAAITITNSTGAFNFAANSSITNPNAGPAFTVSGGAPVINYLGTITQNNAFNAVKITGVTGGSTSGAASPYSIKFGGQITHTADVTSIAIGTAASPNTGGSFGFTGSTIQLTSSTATAIDLNTNAGATITFAPSGSMPISTTTGTGFSAVGGGTVNVNGSSNTITVSGAGTGLVVTNTAIAMTFSNVSASGGTNGLALTGATGTLTINAGTMNNTTAANVLVSGGTVSVTCAVGFTQGTASVPVVSVTNHSSGTLTFSGNFSVSNGTGIRFDNADGTYAFNANVGMSGGDAGIHIINGSAGTFTFNTGSIGNVTNAQFEVADSTASVTSNMGLQRSTGTAPVLSITNHSGGTITFNNPVGNAISATSGPGMSFANADGTYNFNGPTSMLSGAYIEINKGTDNVNGSQGTFSFGTGTSIGSLGSGASGRFVVSDSRPNVTYSGDLTQALAGQPMISITNQLGGTITFQTGTITAQNGTGVVLDNADGTVNFNGTMNIIAGTAGVTIQNGSSGTFSFGSGVVIGNGSGQSPTGTSFSVSGGAPNITFAGSIRQPNGANCVNITGVTGGSISFTAASSITKVTTAATAISLSANSGGTVTFAGPMTLTSGTATAISIASNTGGSYSFTGTTTITVGTNATANGTGVSMSSNTGATISLPALAISVTVGATATSGITASGGGNITLGGSYNGGGANSSAIVLDSIVLGNSTFSSVQWTSGTVGISLNSVTGGPLTINGTGQVNNGTTADFKAINSPIDVTMGTAGSTLFFFGARAVWIENSVAGPCGTKSFLGNISQSAADTVAQGIYVNNCNSGTITFSGATKSINTTGNVGTPTPAVTLTNNAGATINFTNGGLALTTSTAKAFTATGGGTISVTTGTNANTLTSTTGTALEVQNTTIGASGLTFRSISANGGTNGIVINNTGAGALTVTGTGTTAGSGGTIQNTVQGALFTSTQNLSLSNMNFTNANSGNGTVNNIDTSAFNSAAQAAINMSTVTTATFTNLSVDGAGGSGGAQVGINGQNVSNLTLSNSTVSGFGDAVAEGDVKIWNLTGTCSVTNSTFSFVSGDTTGGENLFEVRNGTGSLNLTISDSTFKDTRSSTFGSGGLAFTTVANAAMTLNIVHNSFLNLKTSGVEAIARDTSTQTVNIYDGNVANNGNTFDPQGGTGRAIGLNAEDTATLNFNVLRNVKIYGGGGPIINVIGINNAVIRGRINSNSDIKGQGLSVAGSAVNIHPEDSSDGVFEVTGNTITNVGQDPAIFVFDHGDGVSSVSPKLDVKIANNTVGIVNNGGTGGGFIGATTGIDMRAGANAGDLAKTCVWVTGNAVTASPAAINNSDTIAALFREGSTGSNLYLQNSFTGANNNARAISAWNNGGNSPTGSAIAFDAGSSQAYSSQTCRTVTIPTP